MHFVFCTPLLANTYPDLCITNSYVQQIPSIVFHCYVSINILFYVVDDDFLSYNDDDDDDCFFLYSAILHSREESLSSHVILRE